jgi:hypothetical protein
MKATVTTLLKVSDIVLMLMVPSGAIAQDKGEPGAGGARSGDAPKDKPWDPSVKSRCHFPNVLFAMSEKLNQTRKLGDAFLDQADDVMANIQDLRRRAEGRESGIRPAANQFRRQA